MTPQFDAIDHFHIYVKDRAAAEVWYKNVLGFSRLSAFEFWAVDGGPLTISNEKGNIHLALFESDNVQNSTIAFGVNEMAFFQWIEHLGDHGIHTTVIDHQLSWSIYFKDPDGNPFEVTTYDYDQVAQHMGRSR